MQQPIPAPNPGPFVTVLRGSSAVRLPHGHQIQLRVAVEGEPFLVTIRTRYLPFEGKPNALPRELWVEVQGPGPGVMDAMGKAVQVSFSAVAVLTVAMNAGTEPLQVEFAFDASEDQDEHEYFQNCLLDETGLPRMARTIKAQAFVEFFDMLHLSDRVSRLMMAISQYELALQNFIPGKESLALAHLYMAMEALTPIAKDREIAKHGSQDALLDAWGIAPKVCRHCGGQIGPGELDSQVRLRALFQNDQEVYRDARKASDGLEHGFLSGGEIHKYAVQHRDRLGVLVRHAIMNLISDSAPWRDQLMTEALDRPVPASRAAKYLTCQLIGPGASLAAPDEVYPRFVVHSSIKAVDTDEDGNVTVYPEEKATAILGESVVGQNLKFQIWGPTGAKSILSRTDSSSVPGSPSPGR